jgi:hypothetical protein
VTRQYIRQRPWSPEDDATLRQLYDTQPASAIAAALQRTRSAVKNRVIKLGLTKGHNAGRFPKGWTPWNKGTHWVAGGRSAETRFKPGRPPEQARNYVPIGSERLSKDGYLERKISDDQYIAPARRWRGVHILAWEAAHGPVPKGHAVIFKDGNKTNRALDNLELITRADLMRRNTYHNYGKEIAALVQLKGAITRQINRRKPA